MVSFLWVEGSYWWSKAGISAGGSATQHNPNELETERKRRKTELGNM